MTVDEQRNRILKILSTVHDLETDWALCIVATTLGNMLVELPPAIRDKRYEHVVCMLGAILTAKNLDETNIATNQ
jgi:hypothetical protein